MKEQDLLSPDVAFRLASAVSLSDITMCYEVRNAASSLLWAYREISRLRFLLAEANNEAGSPEYEFNPGLRKYKDGEQ